VSDDRRDERLVRHGVVVQPQFTVRLLPLAEHVARHEVGFSQQIPQCVRIERVDEVIHTLEGHPLFVEKLHELPAGGSGRLLEYGDDFGRHLSPAGGTV